MFHLSNQWPKTTCTAHASVSPTGTQPSDKGYIFLVKSAWTGPAVFSMIFHDING